MHNTDNFQLYNVHTPYHQDVPNDYNNLNKVVEIIILVVLMNEQI